MNEFSKEEYLSLLSELDRRHGVFYHLWDMGKPRFSNEINTAGVKLAEDGNCVDFLLNEKFWNSLNLDQKIFVICHECLHVTLNHGTRLFRNAKTAQEFKAMNFATDVVINHTLVNKFKMKREVIDPENKYCWVDTVFPHDPNLETDKSSEFYFKKLNEYIESNNSDDSFLGSGEGDSEPETVDEHNPSIGDGETNVFDDMGEVLKELDDKLMEEEREFIEDFIKKNKELDEFANKDNFSGSSKAGNAPGNIFSKVDSKKKIKKKKKWETIIKKWSKKYIKQTSKEEMQWARVNRRFSLITGNDLFIPSEMEVDAIAEEKQKIDVWFFQDTSYSCSGYRQRFFDAARSLPEERFNIRMFCFDTHVYETTLESGRLYGFGGTSFSCIEHKITNILNTEKCSYPEAVFVITDGYGDFVHPRKPENWYWFLTPRNSTNYIPSKSNKFYLENYE